MVISYTALALISCSIVLVVAAAYLPNIIAAVDRSIDAMFGAIADPRPLTFSSGSDSGSWATSGAPIDAALQNDLRHEAGVSRRAAARNV